MLLVLSRTRGVMNTSSSPFEVIFWVLLNRFPMNGISLNKGTLDSVLATSSVTTPPNTTVPPFSTVTFVFSSAFWIDGGDPDPGVLLVTVSSRITVPFGAICGFAVRESVASMN